MTCLTKQELLLLYTNILSTIKECDINLILFYGSLLGYYRDNDFINNDDDIDFIVNIDDFKKLQQYIIKNKCNLKKISLGIINDNLIQLYYDRIGPVDFYLFNDYKDDILIKWDGNLLYSKDDIYPLKVVIYNNFKVYIPNNTLLILYQTYGKDWKIPIAKDKYKWHEINSVRKLIM